jgi:hypothetical protein
VFEAAPDNSLDIAPAANAARDTARLWCRKGSELNVTLALGSAVPAGATVQLAARNETDGVMGKVQITPGRFSAIAMFEVPRDGWITVGTDNDGLGDPLGFHMITQYHGTPELTP